MSDIPKEFLDDLHDHQDDHEHPINHLHHKPPLFDRIVFPILSILFLILFSIYATISPVHSTIQGRLESNELADNTLNAGEYTLLFQNNTSRELETLYKKYQEELLVETSVCLKGDVNNKTYTVNSIFYPEIIDQSYTHVSFVSCPKDTIIMLHTHPYKSCLRSDLDKATYEKEKHTNPDLLMIVMCEQHRYNLYDS